MQTTDDALAVAPSAGPIEEERLQHVNSMQPNFRVSDDMEHFRQVIAAAGLEPPETIYPDGRIHRFSSSGKRGDDAGWYVLHMDGLPAGAFGCWRDGITEAWCPKANVEMTAAERESHRRRSQTIMAQRDADRVKRQGEAAQGAANLWAKTDPVISHQYLDSKTVHPYGIRTFGDWLVIPMRDAHGRFHSLQCIAWDGTKRFHPGGRVNGCFYGIGKRNGALIVCEGFATGASIHEATGLAVAVAFTAGNLMPVAVSLHRKYPNLPIVIAADDDWCVPANPGCTHAKAAALAVGGVVVIPIFPADRPAKATDFNDLHAMAGLDAVRSCFGDVLEMEGAAV